MANPLHTVVETTNFVSDARATGLGEDERQRIIGAIASDPSVGDIIPGTGGARKIRFAGRGKGRSGGYRVVTFYGGEDIPVFLLNVFAKGERSDLTQAQRNDLRVILGALAEAYRRGVKRQ